MLLEHALHLTSGVTAPLLDRVVIASIVLVLHELGDVPRPIEVTEMIEVMEVRRVEVREVLWLCARFVCED